MPLVKCPNCNQDISDKVDFCVHCGATHIKTLMYCQDCGNEINENDLLCPNCGCPINGNFVNQNQQPIVVQSQFNNEKKTSGVKICLYIMILLSIIACFFPFISVGNYSWNFVSNGNSVIAEGVMIIGIQAFAILSLALNFPKFIVEWLEFASLIIFIVAFFDIRSAVLKWVEVQSGSSSISAVSPILGSGFYLLGLSILISYLLSLMKKSY